ncbi:hypothetical protein PCANC_20960 [Puccinia coronata f. sp. avenae]|uniref:Uncharacterized protein n=1 Tax=Puccinia coronata f. sp. avenae TaxID=200324 RepID=A0A2N5U0N9_9BASI|nr:hypothetical protein PCANC_22893 [Puccinia coronata f. sp. avenae]PLW35124.1 hypothetical protein PCANC_20960 [Puccinia coronata f. sp. avenae]
MSHPLPARVTFPNSPNLLPPPYSHLPSHQQQQQQQPNSPSLCSTPPPSPLVLPPLNTTLLPAHAPLYPCPSYPLALPTACPPYLYELAQANCSLSKPGYRCTHSSSSSTPPQVSQCFFTPTSTFGISNLRMFVDGLQHYKRVEAPA